MSVLSDGEETIVDPVGATARATAAARARETERPDRLFSDPFAAALAGPEGFQALDRHNAARSEAGSYVANPTFALRTRFFDDFLLRAVADGAHQVVLVAAGLDTRAYRLRWPDDVTVFELDQPEVLAYKAAVLDALGAAAACSRRASGVDLREPWLPALVDAGFRPGQCAAWLAEGLTFYLDESAVNHLFSDIAGLATAGDRLGTDFVSVPPPSFDALIRFTTEEPVRLLSSCGWDAVQHSYPTESERHRRPWPYSGRPRGCLVTARRAG